MAQNAIRQETVDAKSLDRLAKLLGNFDENLNFLARELGVVAYVDGVKSEVLQADTAFMALKIDGKAEAQTIELRYETPYLEEGKVVSFLGLGAFGCVLLGDTTWRLVKKKKNKEQGDNDHV